MSFTSTKTFDNLPCAHRQWRHKGHCSFIHGYSRSVHFVFGASELTPEGFVVDFSDLKDLRSWLENWFDHTLLLNEDDPLVKDPIFMAFCTDQNGDDMHAFDLRILPNVGMEGTAEFVYGYASQMLHEKTNGRAWIKSIEVRENNKNSAVYHANI